MLPKKNRVVTKEVDKIFKEGRFIVSPSFTFKYIKVPTDLTCGDFNRSDLCLKPKISFIAPKNVAKLAVKRNLLRRRGYIALAKYIHQFPLGMIGVLIFKKYQDDVSVIENEIKTILSKIN